MVFIVKLDYMGLLSTCSYTLDCVETELVHVSNPYAIFQDMGSRQRLN